MGASFEEKLSAIRQDASPEARADVEQRLRDHRQAGGISVESTRALCVDAAADPGVRATACWLLGRIHDVDAGPVLLRALDDPEPDVRLQAVAALATLGDAAAVAPLIRVFQHDPETHVRQMATNALWRIGDPGAIAPLVSALLDRGQPPGLRSDCADALGQMADCGDLPEQRRSVVLRALLAVLGDESTEVRGFATFALGMLRDPAALPALRRTLATDEGIDPRWGPVRDEAREAIALIEARPAAPPVASPED